MFNFIHAQNCRHVYRMVLKQRILKQMETRKRNINANEKYEEQSQRA